jgi:hypothetical protein
MIPEPRGCLSGAGRTRSGRRALWASAAFSSMRRL